MIYVKMVTSNLINTTTQKVTVSPKGYRIFLWLFQWTLGYEQKQSQMKDKSKVNIWMMVRPTIGIFKHT